MILGTSKILSNSGPVDLLIITEMLQKMQEKIWNPPGTYFLSMWISKFRTFSKSVCPMYQIFSMFVRCVFVVFSNCFSHFLVVFEYIFWKYFYEDEELKMIHFSLLNSTPTWIWISFMSKTWTGFYPKLCVFMECTLNFCQGRYPNCFQGRYPKLFYFQERESLNIN